MIIHNMLTNNHRVDWWVVAHGLTLQRTESLRHPQITITIEIISEHQENYKYDCNENLALSTNTTYQPQ